jgi:glycosyltransferase involved in cell wall biosynthesis
MTAPAVVYDMSLVAARLGEAPTGIERVDAAFARYFAERGGRAASESQAIGLHHGWRGPHLWRAERVKALLAESARSSSVLGDPDPVFGDLTAWLNDEASKSTRARFQSSKTTQFGVQLSRLKWYVARSLGAEVPRGAIYLNASQFRVRYSFLFRWLDTRSDVKPVFFVHDLLPLDFPEFFAEGRRPLFERIIATIVRHAKAIIASNETVAARIADEMRKRGRGDLPFFCRPLPPPTAVAARPRLDRYAVVSSTPYFVAIGTIEPRKNHLLLLHVWRDLAKRGGDVPKLVLVGARGWDNEQVVDLLERSPLLRSCVAEVSGLSTESLRRLIGGARAVLSPSFEEGYGLPIVEGLHEGTPVIASDIAVFREISQGRALFYDPTDGPAWRRAISELAAPQSALRCDLAKAARGFDAPTWPAYFAALEDFLRSL